LGEARLDGLKLGWVFARIGLLVATVLLVVTIAAQVWSSGREKPGVVEAVDVPNGSTSTNAGAAASSSSPNGADNLLPVGYRVGEKAPDFILRNTNGRQVSLGGFRGQPLLINFWASWCTYCRVEMPELDALYKEDSVRHSLVVLAVDTLDSDRLSAESFIIGKAFSFTVLWDENNRVASQYDVRGLPASFFIDRDGIIRAYSPGAMGRDEMREKAELVY
jgi:peroxiredoxin